MDLPCRPFGLAVPLVLLGFLVSCRSQNAVPLRSAPQQFTGAANPITVDSTEEQIKQAVGDARVGKKLTPKVWPNGAQVDL